MALPAGALGATVTVGSPIDTAGTAGTLVSLRVWPEVPAGLVWAADGTMIEPWSAVGTAGTLTILADQPGVLTSGTVDGAPQMVAIRSWPLMAEWRTKPSADAAPTRHYRRFAAPAPGTTVDLDLLPQDGALPVATITTVQSIYIGADAVPQVQQDATTATAAAAAAALSEAAANGAATTASGAATVATAARDAARLAEIDAEAAAEAAVAARGVAEDARDAASGSALSASGSATVATTKAGEADMSALDASASASAAAASADTASTQAGVATDKAAEATTKAGEADLSATSASGSASTATTKAGEAAASAASAAATLAGAVPKSIVDAKGDLLVGSADDTISRLAVGSNGALLVANSNAASGLEYQTPLPVLVNLLTNSDFSNGTTGWSSTEGTLSTNAGKLRFISGTRGANATFMVTPAISYTAGRKYYFSAETTLETSKDLTATNLYIGPGARQAVLSFPDTTNTSRSSAVFTANSTTNVTIVFSRLNQGKYMDLDNVMLIDLTSCFGAGNEPSKAEMDALMETWGGWFAKETPKLLPSYDWLKRTQNASTNLLPNSHFFNGTTGWQALDYCTLTAANSVLTMTGTGADSSALGFCSAGIQRLGQKIYVRTSVRATSGSAVSLSIYGGGLLAGVISAPILNQWYTPSGIITAPTTGADLGFTFIASYADPASATGQATEWKYPLLIDLTACFGAGNEPTKSEMDHLLTKYPNSWFNGTVNDLLRWYDPMRRVGSGSPYSVIAPRKVGETWTDVDQANGARVWTATGLTTTSWVVTDGDTGTRILTSWTAAGVVTGDALPANVAPTAGSAGSVRVRRCGAQVLYAIRGATWSGESVFTVPVGFRSATAQYRPTSVIVAGAPAAMVATVSTATLTIGASGQSAHATNATVVTWESNPWPVTLPGSPA